MTPKLGGWEYSDPAKYSLDEDLERAWVCVVYSSTAATRAIIRGVPVIYQGPHIICQSMASSDLAAIEDPPTPARERAFRRLAWLQWSDGELRAGIPWLS